MAFISHTKKEIRAKIVYYGPGLSGKTSNVEYIYKKMRSDHRGDLINLSTKDRTLFFDFLPVELGSIKGYATSFHIFTVPGQVFYNETRRAVLKDVDGIVFVADSQKKMRDENERSLKNLEDNLAFHSKKLSDFPHVFQYNKRDTQNVMTVEELHLLLNKTGAPFFEAVATEGVGILNTLKLISKIVLKKLASTATSMQEDESAFKEGNFGLTPDYVALKPGEQAPADVRSVTAFEVGIIIDDSGGEEVETAEPVSEAEEVIEAEAQAVEESAASSDKIEMAAEESVSEAESVSDTEPVHEAYEAIEAGEAVEAAEAAEFYEAQIGGEDQAAEGEAAAPLDGDDAEWKPSADAEEIVEEPQVASNPDHGLDILESIGKSRAEEITAEAIEEPAEAVLIGEAASAQVVEERPVFIAQEAEADNYRGASPASPSIQSQPSQSARISPPPAPTSQSAKEIQLYQWGFPEKIDANTMRFPIFFRDDETGEEFWSYITIGLENIYRRR